MIAHEVGHHVQQQLGTSDEVSRLRREQPGESNALSVRLELQADCYAGLFARWAAMKGRLDPGDVEEGIYISNISGDRPGTPPTDPRAHGTGEQRVGAFLRGYNASDLKLTACQV